jgi:hypothetical protein
MKPDNRTLFQIIVAAGFERQRNVLDAAAKMGEHIPQSTLSSMVRGSPGHPSARKALARVLKVSEDRILEAIGNSAKARLAELRTK